MQFIGIIAAVVQVLTLLVLARAIASWFVRDWSRGAPRFLWDITEPILAPVRRLLPPMMGMDFSPMVVLIGLWLLQGLLVRAIP